jgi:hypothetical protein
MNDNEILDDRMFISTSLLNSWCSDYREWCTYMYSRKSTVYGMPRWIHRVSPTHPTSGRYRFPALDSYSHEQAFQEPKKCCISRGLVQVNHIFRSSCFKYTTVLCIIWIYQV